MEVYFLELITHCSVLSHILPLALDPLCFASFPGAGCSLSILSFFSVRNFFACEFLLSAVVLNSCFLKRFVDQLPLSFVELIFFFQNPAKKRRHSSARIRGYMSLSAN